MKQSHFLIITGLSGAGKTEAVRYFEDAGFFCVDNLPPALIPKFAELCSHAEGKVNKVALVSDVRGGRFFDSLLDSLDELEASGFGYEILFLEASDEALVRRFKQTRRRHPLAADGGAIVDAIAEERRRLDAIRGRAHRVIDTTGMSPRQLHQVLEAAYTESGGSRMLVSVVSFGFKYGIPLDADMVFDVRFLPNPHYVEALKPLSGKERSVLEYVFRWPVTQRFVQMTQELLQFLMPHFAREGKAHLVLAIGCTGGRHRSVALAEHFGDFLRSLGYHVRVDHRDVERRDDELEERRAT